MPERFICKEADERETDSSSFMPDRRCAIQQKGKTMMKHRKLACLLLSVLLFAALALPAMAGNAEAQEASCPHLKTNRVALPNTYTPRSATHHNKITTYRVFCAVCNYFLGTETVATPEPHNMRYSGNTHNPNGTHTYSDSCEDCGHTVSTTYPCSGPPCREPFRVG